MPSEREQMSTWTLDQVADSLSNAASGSTRHRIAMAEILRRQTVIQQEGADAQERAAAAAIETANFTRLNARYMLWSVVVLAAASVGNFLITLFVTPH